jgi:hypothetical protein
MITSSGQFINFVCGILDLLHIADIDIWRFLPLPYPVGKAFLGQWPKRKQQQKVPEALNLLAENEE